MRADCYISVDVEADGPIPGPYSMISFGAAVAGTRTAEGFTAADPTATTFYRELRPISDDFDPAALAVSGLDRSALVAHGADPAAGHGRVRGLGRGHRRTGPAGGGRLSGLLRLDVPVLVPDPLHRTSPFGHSGCLDLKTLYATKADVPLAGAVKARMPRHLLSNRPHTHHALDDAIEQADLCANLMLWSARALQTSIMRLSS